GVPAHQTHPAQVIVGTSSTIPTECVPVKYPLRMEGGVDISPVAHRALGEGENGRRSARLPRLLLISRILIGDLSDDSGTHLTALPGHPVGLEWPPTVLEHLEVRPAHHLIGRRLMDGKKLVGGALHLSRPGR